MARKHRQPVEVVVRKQAYSPAAGCLALGLFGTAIVALVILGLAGAAGVDRSTAREDQPKQNTSTQGLAVDFLEDYSQDTGRAPELRELPNLEYDEQQKQTKVAVDLFMMEDPWWYRIEASFSGERWSKGREPKIRVFRVDDDMPIEAVRIHDNADRDDGMREIQTPGGNLSYRQLSELVASLYGDFLIEGVWVPQSPQSIEALDRFVESLERLDRGIRPN